MEVASGLWKTIRLDLVCIRIYQDLKLINMRKSSSMERSLRLDAIKALDNIRDNLNFSILELVILNAQSGAIYFKVWNVMNIIMHN